MNATCDDVLQPLYRGCANTLLFPRVERKSDHSLIDITGRSYLVRLFGREAADIIAESVGAVTCEKNEADVVTKSQIEFPFPASALANVMAQTVAFAIYEWRVGDTEPRPMKDGVIPIALWPKSIPPRPEDPS